jgi:hypothetical protein
MRAREKWVVRYIMWADKRFLLPGGPLHGMDNAPSGNFINKGVLAADRHTFQPRHEEKAVKYIFSQTGMALYLTM